MVFWWNRGGAEDIVRGDGSDRGAAPDRPLFLRRLDRLAGLKGARNLSAAERRLVDQALYSTYWDCVHLGLRDEADAVVATMRQPQEARREG